MATGTSSVQDCPTKSRNVSVMRWAIPSVGIFKCNCDASVLPQASHIGFRFVILDHEGQLIVAKNGLRDGSGDDL